MLMAGLPVLPASVSLSGEQAAEGEDEVAGHCAGITSLPSHTRPSSAKKPSTQALTELCPGWGLYADVYD